MINSYSQEVTELLNTATIYGINGPVIYLKGNTGFRMSEMVYVGKEKLVGEVIALTKDMTTVQVYEETSGLRPGEEVVASGSAVSVTLAPGILNNIFDGIERPLEEIAKSGGAFITRGVTVDSLDREKKWEAHITVKEGDFLRGGDIIAEVEDGKVGELAITYTEIGEVTEEPVLAYGDVKIALADAQDAWTGTLEKVFATKSAADSDAKVEEKLFNTSDIHICSHKIGQPTVFIPVFPGTNCEYDSARAFERAGAKVITKVFRNLDAEDIRGSVDEFEKAIGQAQMIMFPGGFSAGDEPDGSAKFFATAFQNAKIKEAVEKLLNERDGLALGICNGFQALIKLGLVPYGKIVGQTDDAPTLTYNTIGRHISKMVYTKVVSNKSPWLQKAELGKVYTNPASHGEGRFVANEEWLKKLFENGQVATQYCDLAGNITMDEEWNVNGSYASIEGITSPDGRILGKMAHSERRGDGVAVNIYGEQDIQIFESGVEYFK